MVEWEGADGRKLLSTAHMPSQAWCPSGALLPTRLQPLNLDLRFSTDHRSCAVDQEAHVHAPLLHVQASLRLSHRARQVSGAATGTGLPEVGTGRLVVGSSAEHRRG